MTGDKGPDCFWLYNFEFKSVKEWKQYLTKVEMEQLQLSVNPLAFRYLVDDKLRFYERCSSCGISTPSVLGAIAVTRKLHVPASIPLITQTDQLHDELQKHIGKQLILKSIMGSYGEGFLSIQVDHDKIRGPEGVNLTAQSIIQHCRNSGLDFLIQERLLPHASLRAIMPGPALATIRVVTIGSGKSFVVPYAFAKIPVSGNLTDNFHHGESGNLLAGINVAAGTLMSAWGPARQKCGGLRRIEKHPETGAFFQGTPVPFWKEILDLARLAAEAFRELLTVGWDIAVTEQGLKVLEGNSHYDPDGPQITLQRGIRSEIERFYRRVENPIEVLMAVR